ncbi:kinase-like protein [Exidia glandulosa HHB12029]|uniref:Kinase-like protein n=1 Tax=Exidia glandulosa HHB12029 TaxID=1314781 RepID=A0A165ECV7_EXIGL|nr:kinase-like protein [Exidia glandulosa HHB12029]
MPQEPDRNADGPGPTNPSVRNSLETVTTFHTADELRHITWLPSSRPLSRATLATNTTYYSMEDPAILRVTSAKDFRIVFHSLNVSDNVSLQVSTPVGQGGYSDVMSGEFRKDNTLMRVAIKVPRMSTPRAHVFRKLAQEIAIWQHLSHPNILPLIGLYWGSSPLPAMVSPLCRNGNAVSYLTARRNEANLSGEVQVLTEILDGLIYLHGLQMVHGDLKGANILILDDGTACIGDFGVSAVLDELPSRTATSAGTWRWTAPELFDDHGSHTKSSDMWAFGCVMIELIALEVPYYTLKEERRVILALSKRQIPPRPPGITDDTWDLITDCFSDPKIRPSAERMRSLFDYTFYGGEEVPALPTSAEFQTVNTLYHQRREASLLPSDEVSSGEDDDLPHDSPMRASPTSGATSSTAALRGSSGTTAESKAEGQIAYEPDALHLSPISPTKRSTMAQLQKQIFPRLKMAIRRKENTSWDMHSPVTTSRPNTYDTDSVKALDVLEPLNLSRQIVDVSPMHSHETGLRHYRLRRGRWMTVERIAFVAIKSLSLGGAAELPPGWSTEVSSWTHLQHANIVPVYGLFWTENIPALVSPLCSGGNLAAYIKDWPPSPSAQRHKLALLDQVLRGITHLHLHDPPIIHGNIRGANILITEQGTARLCNFGVWRLEATDLVKYKSECTRKETYRWYAPELVNDRRSHTTETDMWAYGCLRLEIQSGQVPYFALRTEEEVADAIILNELLQRSDLDDSTEWNAIYAISRFCAVDPTERPSAKAYQRGPDGSLSRTVWRWLGMTPATPAVV